jgi:hypothetical protein
MAYSADTSSGAALMNPAATLYALSYALVEIWETL